MRRIIGCGSNLPNQVLTPKVHGTKPEMTIVLLLIFDFCTPKQDGPPRGGFSQALSLVARAGGASECGGCGAWGDGGGRVQGGPGDVQRHDRSVCTPGQPPAGHADLPGNAGAPPAVAAGVVVVVVL